jgi:hypothetical protein
MPTMHDIACAFAFSALIGGQFWAVIIAGLKANPPGGRPSYRTTRQMPHAGQLLNPIRAT